MRNYGAKRPNNSHLRKMSKLYGAVCVATENEKTITAPPVTYINYVGRRNFYCHRLAVNIVVVNEAAAKSPHNSIPSKGTSFLIKLVAKRFQSMITTDMIFWVEGVFF
jgi:hypothetical protein